MLRRILLIALSSSVLALHFQAVAQTYPERPIKILQGFAPGGNADAIARAVGMEMGKTLGQSMVVEAQAGAGGTIAATTVARAKPDGYTLLLATGGHAVAGALYNNLAYRTVQDFEMVSTITYFPFLVVVPANSKFVNLAALLATAKANPEQISYGSAGIGSTHHLAGELLASMSKSQLMHVPYKGDSASLTALLAGDIPMIIAPPTAVMANIKAGKLRALATTGPQRWPGLPDVPTVAEQGYPDYESSTWYGMFAPPALPRDLVMKLNGIFNDALKQPDIIKSFMAQGAEPAGGTPEDLAKMMRSEYERWRKVVVAAKIEVDE